MKTFIVCINFVKQRLRKINFDELQTDQVLRRYGAVLVLAHVVTAARWLFTDRLYSYLNASVESTCWPYFKSCGDFKFLNETGVFIGIGFYVFLALMLAYGFWRGRVTGTKLAVGFLILWILKLAVMISDYHFRHNANYMHFLVSLAFLFGPHRRLSCQWLIVLFYFWAGTLKLNHEWLSGNALYGTLFLIPKWFLPGALIYVVVMELVVVWGLFFRNRRIFYFSFFQVILFHTVSWGSVGFFYPCMMFCILSIFILDRSAQRVAPLLRPRSAVYAPFIYAMIFSCLQIPHWVFSQDSVLTGEGRFLSLDMFDGKVECLARATVKINGAISIVPLRRPGDAIRIRCEPVVVMELARNLCLRLKSFNPWIDVTLVSKRTSDQQWRKIIDQKNFCDARLEYSLLRHNNWILFEAVDATRY